MTDAPLGPGAPPPSRARALATHILFSGGIAAEAVVHNKLRASLTSLGILFGVASVIAMLAIGNGAEQEILAQMKLLGANNIVITPIIEQKEGKNEKDDTKKAAKKFTPGLSYLDAQAIKATLPAVSATSSEVVINSVITREGHHRSGKVVGIDPSYLDVSNMRIAEGTPFATRHFVGALPVAIIGPGVKSRFFTSENPIGHTIKVGTQWLTVVGVLEDRKVSSETAKHLGIRDANMDVYVPLQTMLLRFRNRGEVTQAEMELAAQEGNSNDGADSSQTD
ncbi:MAG: ABC transporter permease, partial [bacterium]